MSIYFEYLFRRQNVLNILGNNFNIIYSVDDTYFAFNKINILSFSKNGNENFIVTKWLLDQVSEENPTPSFEEFECNDIHSYFKSLNPNKLLKFKERVLTTNDKNKTDDFDFEIYFKNLLTININHYNHLKLNLLLNLHLNTFGKNSSNYKQFMSNFYYKKGEDTESYFSTIPGEFYFYKLIRSTYEDLI